jgi:hypothetical protein
MCSGGTLYARCEASVSILRQSLIQPVAALGDHPTMLNASREKLSGAPVNINEMTPREAIRFPA